MQTGAWPWAAGQQTIAALERCLALGVTATARTLEARGARVDGGATQHRDDAQCPDRNDAHPRVRRVAARGRPRDARDRRLRAALADDAQAAAKRALAAMYTVPHGERLSPSPHRLHATALVAAAAGQTAPAMPLTRLLHAAYTMENKRIEPSGQR